MPDSNTEINFQPPEFEGEAPSIGALISERWELIAHIGEGGMSDVYEARHVIMQKHGAVKFLKGDLARDPVAVKRFQQEALAAGTLSHPNIVEVYDCGLCQYGVYLIMEILDGISLDEVLEARAEDAPDHKGVLKMDEAVPIFLQICDGLEHAHKKGIIHRDIKPSNVMLVEPEQPKTTNPEEVQVKLVDFGIAKMVGAPGSTEGDIRTDGSLTRTGEVFGSPNYMSPEQCMGKKLDTRADIYSLGCLMYEAVVGSKVLAGNNSTETMLRHVDEEADLKPLVAIKDPLARPLSSIIQKCLWRDPDQRYANIGQVRQALAALDLPGATKYKSQSKSALVYVVSAAVVLSLVLTAPVIYGLMPVDQSYNGDKSAIAIPVVIPGNDYNPPDLDPAAGAPTMLTNLFDGGETFVGHMNIPPEKRYRYCSTMLKRGDRALRQKQWAIAEQCFGFVFNILWAVAPSVPDGTNMLLHAVVARLVGQARLEDYDAIDIGVGNVIKDSPYFFNAGPRGKRYALQVRAAVQRAKKSYAAAAASVKQMLPLYDLSEESTLADGSSLACEKALWTGELADLIRLSAGPEGAVASLDSYGEALSNLAAVNHSQISDARRLADIMIFRARLYYRYGLALIEADKYNQAFQAFQQSLALFNQQGAAFAPEVGAARVQSYLALKHYDWWGALKYRLQNHL